MAITKNDIDNMEQLACLDIELENGNALTDDVSAIMDFVEQLKQVPTTEIAPLFHPLDLYQRFRADEVTEQDCRTELAQIAPVFEENLYLVPKVIDAGQ